MLPRVSRFITPTLERMEQTQPVTDLVSQGVALIIGSRGASRHRLIKYYHTIKARLRIITGRERCITQNAVTWPAGINIQRLCPAFPQRGFHRALRATVAPRIPFSIRGSRSFDEVKFVGQRWVAANTSKGLIDHVHLGGNRSFGNISIAAPIADNVKDDADAGFTFSARWRR